MLEDTELYLRNELLERGYSEVTSLAKLEGAEKHNGKVSYGLL